VNNWKELQQAAVDIVSTAKAMLDLHVESEEAQVSYCCVFSQTQAEFKRLVSLSLAEGSVANDTKTGPVFVVPEIGTSAGPLRVLKIRKPDSSRPERGDADFAVTGYPAFKSRYLNDLGFSLIVREEFEMIELVDPEYDVRAYFSHPPVEQHAGIREALAGSD
jgi:hypothetical protein